MKNVYVLNHTKVNWTQKENSILVPMVFEDEKEARKQLLSIYDELIEENSDDVFENNISGGATYAYIIWNDDTIEELTIDKSNLYKYSENLLKAVNDFYSKEYDDEQGDRLISLPEDGIIHLAYTTTEDEEHEVQVDFDLNALDYLNYIDGELVLKEHRNSIEEFINEISACDFNDIVRNCMDKLEEN